MASLPELAHVSPVRSRPSRTEDRYNRIADRYRLTDYAIAKRFSYGPSLLHLTGDLASKRVVDVACGSGYSTRLLAQRSPKMIAGIDSSRMMIELANQQDKHAPLGISYFYGAVEEFEFHMLKPIHLITALFLLHYADSRDALVSMSTAIYNALPEGGRFVTITSNPDFPQIIDKQYEVTSCVPRPQEEGSCRFVKYWKHRQKVCSFLTYLWSRRMLDHTLRQTGFRDIIFHQPIVSKDGYEMFGEEFWGPYFQRPHIIGITCAK